MPTTLIVPTTDTTRPITPPAPARVRVPLAELRPSRRDLGRALPAGRPGLTFNSAL